MKTVVLLFLAAVSLTAADSTSLSYKLAKGAAFPYQMVTTTIQNAEVNGATASSTVSMVMPFTVSVSDVVLGSYTVTGRYDTAYVLARSGADSTLQTPATKEYVYGGIAGLVDEVVMTHAGVVISSHSDLDTVAGGFRIGAWSQGLRNLLLQYPETPVGPGSAWSIDRLDTMTTRTYADTVLTTAKYTYTVGRLVDTLGHRCIQLGVTSSDITIIGTLTRIAGATMPLRGSGTATGEIFVELQTGMPVLFDIRTEMTAIVDMSEAKQGTMPLQTKTRATLQRLATK